MEENLCNRVSLANEVFEKALVGDIDLNRDDIYS